MHFRNKRKSAQDVYISDPIDMEPRQITNLEIIAPLLVLCVRWHRLRKLCYPCSPNRASVKRYNLTAVSKQKRSSSAARLRPVIS